MGTDEAKAAVHVAPGEGEMRWLVGDLVTFKVLGEHTSGAFTLAEEVTPPKAGRLPTCTRA